MRFQRPEVWNWSAFDQLDNLREEINRLFETPNNGFARSEVLNSWAPALDLYEDKNNLVVKAELPGLKKEEIEISFHDRALTIAGERKHEKAYEGSETSRAERFFGRFQRTLALPKAVDANQITASYKDGILTVTLPKSEEAKPRQIEVKTK
ncbi:MAG: Hsp20/alpha crystallin family protein [Verrucomicrobiota bacterium]|nr:Hsp20/alpha crystallin family protein [Verrucomicrobiota bacterium]